MIDWLIDVFGEWVPVVLCVLVLGGLLWLAFWLDSREEKQWQSFAAEHHCHETGTIKGGVDVGVNTGRDGGVVPIVRADQKQYTCDGGYTVVR